MRKYTRQRVLITSQFYNLKLNIYRTPHSMPGLCLFCLPRSLFVFSERFRLYPMPGPCSSFLLSHFIRHQQHKLSPLFGVYSNTTSWVVRGLITSADIGISAGFFSWVSDHWRTSVGLWIERDDFCTTFTRYRPHSQRQPLQWP
jgi:hypothetical protein